VKTVNFKYQYLYWPIKKTNM